MSDTARSYQPNQPATTDGLDDFFAYESGLLSHVSSPKSGLDSECPDSWLTLTEAASHFSVNEKTLRRWIKRGQVKATKVPGPRGDEWRVQPGQVCTNPKRDESGLDISSPVIPSPVIQSEAHRTDIESSCATVEPMSGLDNFSPGLVSPTLTTEIDSNFSELIELRTKLAIFEAENSDLKAQLQGAAYRNGYLEAKLEDKEQQILLLTDRQTKQSWWANFSAWFLGRR